MFEAISSCIPHFLPASHHIFKIRVFESINITSKINILEQTLEYKNNFQN